MPKLLIIADDFTGSLDTGVQFSKHRIDTQVQVMRDEKADLDTDCEVLVVDIDSRHVPPGVAHDRVARLVRSALDFGFTHLFKKTDSALRGNVGSELSALLENAPENELIFMPAFPKSGRFTVCGKQYLGNVPISQTVFSRDPFNPVRHDSVADIIHEQSDVAVRCIRYDQYGQLKESPGDQKTILVVDGRNDEELSSLGSILRQSGRLRCLAGCAGFAELLPALFQFRPKPPCIQAETDGRLLISGSINPLAQQQVTYAIQNCGYLDFSLTTAQKLDIEGESTPFEAALKTCGKVAIWSKGDPKSLGEASAAAKVRNIPEEEIPGRIANGMGRIVKSLVLSESLRSLIVFGGDTLLGIAEQLGCHAIKPISEIVPGVVLARFADDRFADLNIVTKAGGYGGEDVVAHIDACLEAMRRKIS